MEVRAFSPIFVKSVLSLDLTTMVTSFATGTLLSVLSQAGHVLDLEEPDQFAVLGEHLRRQHVEAVTEP
jgi:hypothetical protein